MRINSILVEPGDLRSLIKKLENNKDDIFIANENSFIDVDSIDSKYNGNVGQFAVNLNNMTGNREVIEVLKYLMNQKEGIYFPGTLVEDMNGYYLTSMPVISNGSIIGIRRKLTDLPLSDDKFVSVAKRFLDAKSAQKISWFNGLYSEEPMRTLQERIKEEADGKKLEGLKSFNYKGIEILPLICNEIYSAIDKYAGKKVDLILHSACNYYDVNEGERKDKYSEIAQKAINKGMVNYPFYISIAEIGRCPSTTTYKVDKGKIMETDNRIIKI